MANFIERKGLANAPKDAKRAYLENMIAAGETLQQRMETDFATVTETARNEADAAKAAGESEAGQTVDAARRHFDEKLEDAKSHLTGAIIAPAEKKAAVIRDAAAKRADAITQRIEPQKSHLAFCEKSIAELRAELAALAE